MNVARLYRVTITVIGLILLCSCATPPARLPVVVVPMNKEAGAGDLLLIPLRLNDKGEHLFVLDTGAPVTMLDLSFGSELGQPTGSNRVISIFGTNYTLRFRSPSLYLGDTRLQTATWVVAWDLERMSAALSQFNGSSHRLAGVLGMDCLQHYCLQLDFEGRAVRFLDSNRLHSEELGAAYRLSTDRQGCPIVDGEIANFGGFPAIDTGCIDKSKTNIVGLDFLSRYVVTLNFPKHIMYLKPTPAQPNSRGSQ